MAVGVKILTFTAILCILVWVAFVAIGAQPLAESAILSVIYGEGEEFYGDATVYQKLRNDTLYFLHLPRARPPYQWWAIDFPNATIMPIPAPRSLGPRKYLLRGDQKGPSIGHTDNQNDWFWHFTESGAAFSGDGFMCSVRKAKSN